MVDAAALLDKQYENLQWANTQLSTLQKKYSRRFVAFGDKEIIAHAGSLHDLMDKLREQDIDTTQVTIEHVSRIKTIL